MATSLAVSVAPRVEVRAESANSNSNEGGFFSLLFHMGVLVVTNELRADQLSESGGLYSACPPSAPPQNGDHRTPDKKTFEGKQIFQGKSVVGYRRSPAKRAQILSQQVPR